MTAPPTRPIPSSDLLTAAVEGIQPRTALDLLLADVENYVRRFVAFPSEGAVVAFVLWAAHTHALDAFESTPRLALLSPEPGSGKTRAQEILELLVMNPLFSLNTSAAALFRTVADPDGRPVVLIDECDTIFGPKASKDNEDIRGFVNAGHRRGAVAHRCVIRGKEIDVVAFPAFAAVSLSGLDDLPDTIMTRSVVIRMRRRAPHEKVEPYRRRLHAHEGHDLRDRLDCELSRCEPELADSWPDMPDGVEDRAADVWEALLAVADIAGGDWPDRARVAAVADVAGSRQGGETLGIRLLADVRRAFADHQVDKLPTTDLLLYLNSLEDAPWGDLRGKPLDPRGLSRRLTKYEITPRNIRIGDQVHKGYVHDDLTDAWSRYLSPSSQGSATSATAATGGPSSYEDDPRGWPEVEPS